MHQANTLLQRLRELCADAPPLPGKGATPARHLRLMQVGREDLSLARLAEAHWDALSILAEAGRPPVDGALYGVWASEIPGRALTLQQTSHRLLVSGTKQFCSGVDLVDRALVTVGTPAPLLLDLDLRQGTHYVETSTDTWKTDAFRSTHTGTISFNAFPAALNAILGPPGWYTSRPGFWHGACGPAACWAGGAAGLVDVAASSTRHDAHTLAHLGALRAAVWALHAFLTAAGEQIDADPDNYSAAQVRALTVRHLVEQACTDILRRFARAYGPAPLSMDESTSRRYHELDIYLRQCHAERDLEALATAMLNDEPPVSPSLRANFFDLNNISAQS